ncbi:MAG TPA: phosphate/phosphite/phosphonate ABC transporter substrate-binding protein [Anaerolineales bacterium]|nr:phosphate/phosphite/phosphonate ABC transporter substrate-binding protein [Anaerolineales bacterium]
MKKILFLLILLASCSPLPQPPIAGTVDLNDLQPLPTPANSEAVPLRVAIAAVISPKGTLESYSPFLSYLEAKLNRPVELVQRRTYLEVNDLIEHGEVDLAFVCTSAYIQGHDTFGMELLVAPQVEGKTTYNSYLIVPADSEAQSLRDLRGKVFAFTDPISLSGRVYPTYLVHQLGFTPEEFFARTFFTYSHDEAIRAVASDVADGAAVDSLVYEYALARDPSLAEKVRVIHVSPDFAIPPVVVSPFTRPQVKADLQTLFLEMSNDPNAQAALASIGVEKFVMIEDSAYDDVRELIGSIPLSSSP